MSHPSFSLLLGTGLLALVAGWDIAKRRIPNWANAALASAGIVMQALNNGLLAAGGAIAAALVALVVLWTPWTRGRLGGGDVKASLSAATWIGFGGVLFQFALYAALAVGAVALICFVASSAQARREIRENMQLVVAQAGLPEAPIRSGQGRVSVPFGAAVAAAATFILWFPR